MRILKIFFLILSYTIFASAQTAAEKEKTVQSFLEIRAPFHNFLADPYDEESIKQIQQSMAQLPADERKRLSLTIAEFTALSNYGPNRSPKDMASRLDWLDLDGSDRRLFQEAMELKEETPLVSTKEKIDFIESTQNPFVRMMLAEQILYNSSLYAELEAKQKITLLANLRMTAFDTSGSFRYQKIKDTIYSDKNFPYLEYIQTANMIEKSYAVCGLLYDGSTNYKKDSSESEDQPTNNPRHNLFKKENLFSTLVTMVSQLADAHNSDRQQMCDISPMITSFKQQEAISQKEFEQLMDLLKGTKSKPSKGSNSTLITDSNSCNLKQAKSRLLKSYPSHMKVTDLGDIEISANTGQRCTLFYEVNHPGDSILIFKNGDEILDKQTISTDALMEYFKRP